MESIINQLLFYASEIAKIYKKLAEFELQNIAITTTKEYANLKIILEIEESLYKRISVEKINSYLEYMNTKYSVSLLKPAQLLNSESVFSSEDRVYSQLFFLKRLHNYYNEMHTECLDNDCSSLNLFYILLGKVMFHFFERGIPIKKTAAVLYAKYNVLFSFCDLEKYYWNQNDFPSNFIEFYFKYMNLNKYNFYQKISEDMERTFYDLVNSLKENPEKFYQKLPLLDMEMRILLFLNQNKIKKAACIEYLQTIICNSDNLLVKKFLENVCLGNFIDEEMNLNLLK